MKKGTIYKGKSETKEIIFSRVWAMPNHQTFKIGPIKELLGRYVKTQDLVDWADPFAGANSPATVTNDHNPAMPTTYHMEALAFALNLRNGWDGVLFDPPYSFRQISEHYKHVGMKATQWQTSMAFYEKVKSALADKVKVGGHVISFGWNSNGFGKARGYKIVEIMLVAHGGSKNDTVVVVEEKMRKGK